MSDIVVEKISPECITVGARQRAVNPEKVKTLAESMKTIGMVTPISVWSTEDGAEVHLVAGAHRLAAAIELGWEQVDCIVLDTMSDIDRRRRWEIAENLHRSELTALERDKQVAEWERLGIEAGKLRKESAVSSGGRGKKGGTREVARELGIDEKEVRNARKVASLTDEAKAAAIEVGLDNNRTALLKAASTPAEKQADVVRSIAEKKAAAVPPRRGRDPGSNTSPANGENEAALNAIINAYVNAPASVKKRFLHGCVSWKCPHCDGSLSEWARS